MRKLKLKVKRESFSSFFFFTLLTPFIAVNFPSTTLAAPIPLRLDQAIDRMMESNLSIKSLALNYELAEINYDAAWHTFYMPNISLSAASTSTYSIGDLSMPNTPGRDNPDSVRKRGYPESPKMLELSIGSYTLFNFFKDRTIYDIAKLNFENARLVYKEAIRSAKFVLMGIYFNTKTAQEKMEASERSMTIAQAIAELMDSRKKLGKASEDEQNSASVDLSSAKVDYSSKKKDLETFLVSLNSTLNAAPNTEFTLTTEPPYVPVRLEPKTLFEIFKSQSPSARTAENALTNAEMNVSLAEKSRLPLPKVDFSGLTIDYGSGFGGGTRPSYTPTGQLEVSAMVSLTIPIWGPAGFNNANTVRTAYINRENAEIAQKNALQAGENRIQTDILTIKKWESDIKELRESFAKNSKILDNTFKKASNTATDRLQLRDALKSARDSEQAYLDALLGHITAKNGLAEFLGLDRLPGDQL